MKKSGNFIISLDFELFWGMRDHTTIESYGENILGVRKAIPMMLESFDKYKIKATFATVGFLFASEKEELRSFFPKKKPQYEIKDLSPYNEYFSEVKNNEDEDEYHFASKLIASIRKYPYHEIATHTFSHYYCLEKGQTIDSFRKDIISAIRIAENYDIKLKSIVFPRNQINKDYLKICNEYGIDSYRGNENSWIYKAESRENENLFKRFIRLLDSYFNISGHNTYSINSIIKKQPYNIPSSSFLRPFNPALKVFEGLKINRIINSMTYAAKNSEVFHLCWHPHNFGKNTNQNIEGLTKILKHYNTLHSEYNFESITMGELSQILKG